MKSLSAPAWLELLAHDCGSEDPVQLERQKLFILLRLAAGGCALALAPLYLLLVGLPTAQHLSLFVLSLTPFVSIGVLKRTGDLSFAQKVSICGWSALAVGVGLSAKAFEPVAAMLLTVALIEAALTLETIVVGAVACAGFVLVAIYAGLPIFGDKALFPGRPEVALAGAPLLCYAALLASGAVLVEQARARADRRSARDLRLLTAALGDIVAHFDRRGASTSILGDTHRAYGLERRDLLGRGFLHRVHVADRPAFLTLVADAAATGEPSQTTLRLLVNRSGPDGDVQSAFLRFEARSCPVAAPEGLIDEASGAVVCILRNVTAAARAEDEIAAARRESELALMAKTRFLANVSHELRTPLNAIIGFSEMLASPELEFKPQEARKRREYARIISESGRRLQEVVNTIIDISKIEAGAMQILIEPFSLGALMEQCCETMRPKAQARQIALAFDHPPESWDIWADKRACKQILLSLLSNAIKFTLPSGRVELSLAIEGAHFAISVKDTGVGISPADLAKLGEPFFQANATDDRAFEGAGLGLAVVRGLVGLHGGRIGIESAPRFGTTVTVRLPQDCRGRGSANTPVKIETIVRHAGAGFLMGDKSEVVKKIA
jgi:two-component system, cell cycle sensor histidine kinase DivJ